MLVGHSQGAGLLTDLLAEEIDDEPAVRDRLVSALLLGTSVAVPDGEDVGGDFEEAPVCRAPDQTGCVVTYRLVPFDLPLRARTALFGAPREGTGVSRLRQSGGPGRRLGLAHPVLRGRVRVGDGEGRRSPIGAPPRRSPPRG